MKAYDRFVACVDASLIASREVCKRDDLVKAGQIYEGACAEYVRVQAKQPQMVSQARLLIDAASAEVSNAERRVRWLSVS